MELQYLCLAFGFAGKYQVMERGHERLADVQQDLYRKIRNHRGPSAPELSLRWRGLEDRRNPLDSVCALVGGRRRRRWRSWRIAFTVVLRAAWPAMLRRCRSSSRRSAWKSSRCLPEPAAGSRANAQAAAGAG